MNEQRFDKIFRDKLANYSQIPSTEADKKLLNLLKDQKLKAWIQFARLAAALALIAVSVYIVGSWNDNDHNDITQQTFVKSAEPTNNVVEATPQEITPAKPEENASEKPAVVGDLLTQPVRTPGLDKMPPALADESKDILEEETTEDQPVKPKVTITYKKSPAPPEPRLALQSQSEQKPKGLKKFWEKAQGINYSDISLGGIRSAKDQLLAIERKEKDKESKSN